MKIFKAEQWNMDLILPLFEQYRTANGMPENPERTFAFLSNRIRFSESILFIAVNAQQQAIGFIQLFPRLSSLQLQRYWQLTDIFALDLPQKNEIYQALLDKAKEFVSFTQSNLLVIEQAQHELGLWERMGFKFNGEKNILELNL